METDEIREFIIRELTRFRSRNEIITEVCEKYGYGWDKAEELVRRIEMEDQEQISSRQKPLLAGVNLLMAVGGLVIALAMVYLAAAGLVIIWLRAPIPYLGNAIFFFIGMGMAIRGIVGFIKIFTNPHP